MWIEPNTNELIPVSNSSYQEYDITGLTRIFLSWGVNNLPYPISTTTMFYGTGNVNISLPNINANGCLATFYLYNSTSGNISITTSDNVPLITMPQATVVLFILKNQNADTQKNGWVIVPMNIGNQVMPNLSTVTSKTITNENNTLNTISNVITNTSGALPSNPILISSYTGNDIYVSEAVVETNYLLGVPAPTDIGKIITFKNVYSSGLVVKLPSSSKIDSTRVTSGSLTGLDTVQLNTGESITLAYSGKITAPDSSLWDLWIVTNWITAVSPLFLGQTVLLSPLPSSQATELSLDQVTSDVLLFSLADPANPPVGTYAFKVTAPIAKVYYISLDPRASNATVTIKFGTTLSDSSSLITIKSDATSSTGYYQFFVTSEGRVIQGAFSVGKDIWATQQQVNIGQINNLGVTPKTLKGSFLSGQPLKLLSGKSFVGTDANGVNPGKALVFYDSTETDVAKKSAIFYDGSELMNKTITASSTTNSGITRYATNAEILALTEPNAAITPSNLGALANATSTTQRGLVRYATDAEVSDGTLTTAAVTPLALQKRLTALASTRLEIQPYNIPVSPPASSYTFTVTKPGYIAVAFEPQRVILTTDVQSNLFYFLSRDLGTDTLTGQIIPGFGAPAGSLIKNAYFSVLWVKA